MLNIRPDGDSLSRMTTQDVVLSSNVVKAAAGEAFHRAISTKGDKYDEWSPAPVSIRIIVWRTDRRAYRRRNRSEGDTIEVDSLHEFAAGDTR